MDKFIDSLFYKNSILLKINIKNKIFIMAINSSTKFGVVYTTPEALANKLASDPSSLVSGKLYFAAGATSGAIGQGLYVYNDGSADGDSVGTVAMVGAGSVVDGNHAGLVSPDLLKRWNDASTTADLALVKANQVASALDNYLPKAGGTLTGALTSRNIVPSADSTYTLGTDAARYKTIYADSFVGTFSGTATNATNASTADVAKKVDSSLYIKVNNTQRIAYDAGDAKTLDISAGSNVSLSWDSSNSRVTIAATDTTYSNGDGISLSGTTFSHADTTNTTANASYGPTADASQVAKDTITIEVPQIKVDKFGHVSDVSVRTFKVLDTDTNTWRAVKVNGTQKIASTASTALDLSAGANISLGYSDNKVTIATTGVPTTTEMNTAISTAVSSLFKYVGDASKTPTSATVGQTWRASAAFTIAAANSVTGAAVSVEVGDVLLCTTAGPKFTVIQNNITNNVSFSETPTNQNLVMFDGATGQVKNSGIDVTVLNQTISTLDDTYASKEHTHNYANIVTGGTTANQILVSNANGKFTLTNLSAIKAGDATSADTADTANKVANTFDISVGGSDVLTFNGSANKTIAFKSDGSTSVTHSNGVITISSTDTKYTHPVLGSGTTVVDTSAITAATPVHGGKFTVVTGATRDASGHITKVVTQQITLPADSNTDTKVTDSSSTAKSFLLGHTTQGTNEAATTNASVYMSGGYLYSGGTKVSVEGHSHSYLSSQTWRPIKINNSQKLANTSSAALDISAGTNISLTWDSTNNRVTINASEYAIYWETLS